MSHSPSVITTPQLRRVSNKRYPIWKATCLVNTTEYTTRKTLASYWPFDFRIHRLIKQRSMPYTKCSVALVRKPVLKISIPPEAVSYSIGFIPGDRLEVGSQRWTGRKKTRPLNLVTLLALLALELVPINHSRPPSPSKGLSVLSCLQRSLALTG